VQQQAQGAMISLKHNKKRNVGLVYELLARYLAEAIIAGDDVKVKKAKLLASKHFNKSTDICKELKLFRALHETKLPDKSTAVVLVEKVKSITRLQSQKRLDLEKTALLTEINSELGSNFFDTMVEDYKTYAIIQVLLNSWRSTELFENISETVILEERLLEHLQADKKKPELDLQEVASSEVNGLVLKIMAEKINHKFGSTLNETQKRMIQYYGVSDKDKLLKEMLSLKDRVLVQINKAVTSSEYDTVVKDKLNQTKELLTGKYGIPDVCNQEVISYYLGMSKLEMELGS
jgi:hypothetical protein